MGHADLHTAQFSKPDSTKKIARFSIGKIYKTRTYRLDQAWVITNCQPARYDAKLIFTKRTRESIR